jgi:hypothetical protein
MSETKSSLQRTLDELKVLEERARKLKNQNIADVIAAAYGRLKQLGDHPDLDRLDDKPASAGEFDPKAPTTKEEAIDRMRKDGDADPEGTARTNWPHLFDAGAPFPGASDPSAPQSHTGP